MSLTTRVHQYDHILPAWEMIPQNPEDEQPDFPDETDQPDFPDETDQPDFDPEKNPK